MFVPVESEIRARLQSASPTASCEYDTLPPEGNATALSTPIESFHNFPIS